MPQNTDLIREKLNVADVVRQYVALAPAGKNLKGLCPFHKEKSPSFVVSPDRGIWHCFGCGAGGDIFGFVMKFENIEFIDALKLLADKAGVSLQHIGTNDQKKYETLYEINRVAKDFFRSTLHEDLGRPALKYLLERGLKKETIEEFEIGLALPNSDALLRHLTKMGYPVTDIEKAGVIFKTDRGMYWDRFKNRIMFPIHNHFGKVVGFTGRVLPGQESADVGKYVNSPETPIFNKSKLLFGFWKTKAAIREAQTAVLVEGQMDFLMTYQDGVANVAASSGTALTADHLQVLRRVADNLVLSFDNDAAGKMAAERSIDDASQLDFGVKVLQLDGEEAKDPADIALARPGHLRELVAASIPAMEYYFKFYGVSQSGEIGAKKKALRLALSKIKALASPVEASHWLEVLAQMSRVSSEVLRQEMAMLKTNLTLPEQKPEQKFGQQAEVVEPPKGRIDVICRQLLSLALLDPKLQQLVRAEIELLPLQYRKIFDHLTPEKGTLIPSEIVATINLLHLQLSMLPPELVNDPTKIEKEVHSLLARLRAEEKDGKKKVVQAAIAQAEAAGDGPKLAQLLEEYRILTKQ